jgi:hypothetical protein
LAFAVRALRASVGHDGAVKSRKALGAAVAGVLLFGAACGPRSEPASSPPPPAPSAAPAKPRVAVVEGSVIVKDCPSKLHKQARKTLDALVGDCTSVPGGSARFLATLQPGGRIEISASDGSNEGTIPICVLQNKLRHKLFITKECAVEVRIEETSLPHNASTPDK